MNMKGLVRMIHFDFIVSDEEARTIFECISEEIVNTQEEIISMRMARSTNMNTVKHIKKQIEWLEERVKYLENLKAKMGNIRV